MLALAVALAAAAAPPPNTLSDAEKRAGYDLLFNGQDLEGWHGYGGQTMEAWTAKSDAPLGARIESRGGVKNGLVTDKRYQNFDLKVEVQIPIDGQSGIFARYEENAPDAILARSGPEFNICGPDDADCRGQTRHFGACYDMFGVVDSLRATWFNPSGTWNEIRIVAYDSNYVHYGNGKKLLEYKIGTREFIRSYNQSRYVADGNNGRYYDIHPGGFMLQHHGETGTTFRNFKAKPLDVHPFLREFPGGSWPDRLPQDFVFGGSVVISVAPKRAPLRGLAPIPGRNPMILMGLPGGRWVETNGRLWTFPAQ